MLIQRIKVIRGTFDPFLKPNQQFPEALVAELLKRYSSREGYDLYPDVAPFFEMLRNKKRHEATTSSWKWDKTVVGIITNSDNRVPDILDSFGLKIGPRRVGSPDQRNKHATIEDDISFTVLSYDVGFEKPDHRIFDAATDMLKETLEADDNALRIEDFEKLHVGDDVEKDYEGAGAAGWDRVLLHRKGNQENSEMNNTPLETTEVRKKDGTSSTVVTAQSLQALNSFHP